MGGAKRGHEAGSFPGELSRSGYGLYSGIGRQGLHCFEFGGSQRLHYGGLYGQLLCDCGRSRCERSPEFTEGDERRRNSGYLYHRRYLFNLHCGKRTTGDEGHRRQGLHRNSQGWCEC